MRAQNGFFKMKNPHEANPQGHLGLHDTASRSFRPETTRPTKASLFLIHLEALEALQLATTICTTMLVMGRAIIRVACHRGPKDGSMA